MGKDDEGILDKIKDFLKNAARVMRVATKPSSEEFLASSKITGLGIILVGTIGFLMFLVFQFIGLF